MPSLDRGKFAQNHPTDLKSLGHPVLARQAHFPKNVHSFAFWLFAVAFCLGLTLLSTRIQMQRKRSAHNLTTAQVARLLGVTKKTLYRMLQDGRIPEPVRNPDNNYRLWIPQQIEAIRQELAK
jgi:predicted DNA-binding transcriptional regulator AlpA